MSLIEDIARDLQPEETSASPTSETPARRRGRRKGTGYDRLDALLLPEVHRLLTEGLRPSIAAATRELAARAYGAGSPGSKARRLARRYAKAYPCD